MKKMLAATSTVCNTLMKGTNIISSVPPKFHLNLISKNSDLKKSQEQTVCLNFISNSSNMQTQAPLPIYQGFDELPNEVSSAWPTDFTEAVHSSSASEKEHSLSIHLCACLDSTALEIYIQASISSHTDCFPQVIIGSPRNISYLRRHSFLISHFISNSV